MSKLLYPSLSQSVIHTVLNSESDPNSATHSSPQPSTAALSSSSHLAVSDLLHKLIYVNKTRKNPLAYQPLFRNLIDEAIRSKISASCTKDLLNFYKIRAEEESSLPPCKSSSLRFNSNFESGNLFKAYQHKDKEYVLLLKPDHGNIKYTHWFYFKVKPTAAEKITFHIVNITKKDLGLITGQQIVAKRKDTWERAGSDICFQETSEFSQYVEDTACFVLSFSYTFEDKSEISMAYSFPYTYSQLTDWLQGLRHEHHDIVSVQPLCTSLGGNSCHLLTITSEVSLYLELKKNQISEKKAIIFMGRVHPSESPASYIMQGLVNFLVGNSFEARALRKHFVFKIIPMMNPDGVKHGNSRCSLLGVDLNRRWIEANEIFHPEVFYAKEMIRNTKDMHEIAMCCDIHSHAKKRNIFMYGCRVGNPDKTSKKRNLLMKMIPILMARKNKNFAYKDCNFKMEKDKEGTGRVVMYKEFGITHSYTIETSFFGRDNNESFTINDWETIGSDLGLVCLNLLSPLTVKNSLKIALEWYKKQKSKKKIVKIKNKNKKGKPNKASLEVMEVHSNTSSDEANDFIIDNEKLPKLQSPNLKVMKIAKGTTSKKERNKGISVNNLEKGLKSHRTLKGSLDLKSSRKLLDAFPSLELIPDVRTIESKARFTASPVKHKDKKNKLPVIKQS